MTFWKIAFRVLLAMIVGALAGALFKSVLPAALAYVVAIVVTVAELVASLASGQRGAGGSVRLMMRMGAVLLSWPITAWLLAFAFEDRGVRIGLAAAVASAIGMGAAKNGYGQDTARLFTVLVATAIPVYAALAAVLSGNGPAMIAACGATAVAPLTAAVANVWPATHHARLMTASAVCVAAGFAVFLRTLI